MLFNRMGNDRETLQISRLREEQKKSRGRIGGIREKIRDLVENSLTADDLGEKVNACEYRILKEELAAEEAHLEDLGQTIERLTAARRTRERQKALREIVRISDQVDVDSMIEAEDYLHASREVRREEDEAYREAWKQERRLLPETEEDEEFRHLLERARMEKTAAPEETRIPEKTEAAEESIGA